MGTVATGYGALQRAATGASEHPAESAKANPSRVVACSRMVQKASAAAVALLLGLISPAVARATAQTQMVATINVTRKARGLPPVRIARPIHRIALQHSDSMATRHYFAHTSPSGVTLKDRILRSGFVQGYYWRGAETLAYGYRSAKATVRAWLGSSEHRAVLLSPTFQWVGIGRAFRHGTAYWTADWVRRWR